MGDYQGPGQEASLTAPGSKSTVLKKAVTYAENFRGGAKFRHNHVTHGRPQKFFQGGQR